VAKTEVLLQKEWSDKFVLVLLSQLRLEVVLLVREGEWEAQDPRVDGIVWGRIEQMCKVTVTISKGTWIVLLIAWRICHCEQGANVRN
jgi:hypothetical protein